jgi:predicted nucleic acid-binding protein
VKAFLDTSVLVATFYGDHEHHAASIDLFLRHSRADACCAGPSLAEVYSSLTAMPGAHRVGGDEALLFLENIRERLTIVTLGERDYLRAVQLASAQGVAGGGIYDVLLASCALKAGADAIYTWNVKHFKRLGPGIAGRVQSP